MVPDSMHSSSVNPWPLRLVLCALAGVLIYLGAGLWLARDDSLGRLQRAGVIRVGYSVGPPLVDVNGGSVPRGTAVDDIPGIAGSLGIAGVTWVQTSYSQLIPDLLDRRFDVVAGQLFQSPGRARQVAFSLPVAELRYGVLVPKGNPGHVASFGQLRPQPGFVVAVIRQSIAGEMLSQRGFTDAGLINVAEGESGESSLRVGAAQALVRTEPALAAIEASHPQEFELISDPVGTGPPALRMGYAFHPEDRALQQAWDKALERLKASREPR